MSRLLLADIGGTYARLAGLSGNEPGPAWSFEVRAYGTNLEPIEHFVEGGDGVAWLDGALLAVASPLVRGRCKLTHSSWIVDQTDVKDGFGVPAIRLIKDLEATARDGLGRSHV